MSGRYSEKDYDKNAVRLGQFIKEKIAVSGMNQAGFAFKLGMSPSRLSNYITGARLPDFFTLCRIAEQLDVPLDEFHIDKNLARNDETVYVLTVCGNCTVKLEKQKRAD